MPFLTWIGMASTAGVGARGASSVAPLPAMLAIGFFTEPWLYLTETASQSMAERLAR